jgi:hypothetical protein
MSCSLVSVSKPCPRVGGVLQANYMHRLTAFYATNELVETSVAASERDSTAAGAASDGLTTGVRVLPCPERSNVALWHACFLLGERERERARESFPFFSL